MCVFLYVLWLEMFYGISTEYETVTNDAHMSSVPICATFMVKELMLNVNRPNMRSNACFQELKKIMVSDVI